MTTRILAIVLLVLSSLAPMGALGKADPFDIDIDIPHTVHTLDNGLTLIVHEDHKAPIAAVNIWYHVGSKDEVEGKTGFAHLFEHLMFNGSENYDDDYFRATEKLGATRLNGTTSFDRTNYFQNVPVNALDAILWLESDRMANLLGAITQEKLDEQRDVVKNEKRQRENRPYGKGADIQYANIYPAGHPYSWLPIGSMEDLDAATLDDVHAWFKRYYGASNTVVVVAGAVNTDEVIKKVEHYFGEVEPGPTLVKHEAWVPRNFDNKKQITFDRVPQTMILKSWHMPGHSTATANYLSLVSDVLASGKTSRLYQRLVYEQQLVSSISAYISPYEIAGTFEISAMVIPGVDEAVVDAIIEEELARFIKEGPTKKELERVKIQNISGFIRGLELVGGFGGKSDLLASNYIYRGDPTFYKQDLQWIKEATRDDLQSAAAAWLSDGRYQLEIHPFPERQAAVSTVDRSGIPEPGELKLAEFERFERAELKNGLKVIFARRDTVPTVQFQLSLDAGYASDTYSHAGVAKLAMDMLDEGTLKRDALEINESLILLGASVGAGSNLDTSFVSLSTLSSTLDDSLGIYADVVLNPSFPEKELERLRLQLQTGIKQEKQSPLGMAQRVLTPIVYGEGHPYGNPRTGSGTEASVAAITRDDVVSFHDTWFKPNSATMIVVGDTTLDDLLPKIEKHFGRWKPGAVPVKKIDPVAKPESIRIFLIDRPESPQSLLLGGHITLPKANPDEIAIGIMNDILGGMSTSRVNMNLREDKGWSYGAQTGIFNARGQRVFFAYAPVQTDQTANAIAEVMSELRGYLGVNVASEAELSKAVAANTLTLSGRWESAGSVLGTLSEIVQYNLPDDYYSSYAGRVSSLAVDDLHRAAERVIDAEAMTWIVVGDKAKIGSSLEELGQVIAIDADGNRL